MNLTHFSSIKTLFQEQRIMVKSDRAECVKAISVLGVEDSAIHYLTGEARITNCSHCTCNVLVPVPCPGCIHIVFCSIKCRYINQSKPLISDFYSTRCMKNLALYLSYFQKCSMEHLSQVRMWNSWINQSFVPRSVSCI